MAPHTSADGQKALSLHGGPESSNSLMQNGDRYEEEHEAEETEADRHLQREVSAGTAGTGLIPTSTSALVSHSLADSYRRPSGFTMGPRGTVVPRHREDQEQSTFEWQQGLEEERSLLAENGVIPSSSISPTLAPRRKSRTATGSSRGQVTGLLSLGLKRSASSKVEEEAIPDTVENVTETSPLLGNGAHATTSTAAAGDDYYEGGESNDSPEVIDRKWQEAVAAGLIHTTWQREAKVLVRYSAPLAVTFILQNSLTVASIFTLGRVGKVELGAVSLASMTASITGYAVYQGLSTSLDTLCAQAFGSGRKELVGLHMQRMMLFLWVITIPIAMLWFFADRILSLIVPEPEVARLAGLYLKIVLLGCPGYVAFEAGKRFVQAQGLFAATSCVLIVCGPLNAFLNWLFVWQFGWGFVGAPIAVAIIDNLLPLLLFLYVYFIDGMECWNGFTPRALQNWGPMVRLAIPGLIMVEAEVLAFEILTLASSYFGTTALAAQSILASISSLTYTVPFSLSIAGSTRIANFIGAALPDAARTCAKVEGFGAIVIGFANVTLLSAFRGYIPWLFTSEPDVVQLAARVLPVCASFQLFDALAAQCNGVLRGLGRQYVGGYVQLICYYGIAIPISMGAAFGLGWSLSGLWAGVAVGLFLVSLIEGTFLIKTDWQRAVVDATKRNEMA